MAEKAKKYADVTDATFLKFCKCPGDYAEVTNRITNIAQYFENENLHARSLLEDEDAIRAEVMVKKDALKILKAELYDKLGLEKEAGRHKKNKEVMDAEVEIDPDIWALTKDIIQMELSLFPIRRELEGTKRRQDSLQVLRDMLKLHVQMLKNESFN